MVERRVKVINADVSVKETLSNNNSRVMCHDT